MAKFFIPASKDENNAEIIYDAIKKFNATSTACGIRENRIFSIHYAHNGISYYAEVGQIEKRTKEIIVAILESERCYFVCTPNRGVLRGAPILVGKNEAGLINKFDN